MARENKVVMYRKYREGDLPDIQIKHSDLITPLQALAQVRLISYSTAPRPPPKKKIFRHDLSTSDYMTCSTFRPFFSATVTSLSSCFQQYFEAYFRKLTRA